MSSTFGVTDEQENFEDALDNENDECENILKGTDGTYNLPSVARLQYSNAAMTTIADDINKTTILK